MEQAFSGIVEEVKRDKNNNPVLMVKIVELSARYATPIKVPEDIWKDTAVGTAMNMILVRENLKANKDGSQPWHYYWGWGRYATEVEGKQAQAAATVAVATEDRKDRAIRRAVALKAAVDFLTGSGGDLDLVLEVSERFDTWLAVGVPIPAKPQQSTQTPRKASAKSQANGEVIDGNTFWSAVRKLYPDKRPVEVQKIVLPLFAGSVSEWVEEGRDWAAAFEHVKAQV